MKVAVIGASGWLGGSVAAEAVGRGHEVTGIVRHPERITLAGVVPVGADATEADAIAAAVAGHDAVVASVTDRTGPDRSVITTVAAVLVEVLPQLPVTRLVWMGGAGSLEPDPGTRFMDEASFPAEAKAEALAQAEALEILAERGGALSWSYLSPAGDALERADKTGSYHVQGGRVPIYDAQGRNRVTSGDLAACVVDELESPQFVGGRFTVASV